MWPGFRKSVVRADGEASVRQARARSWADIPVVMEGSLESMDTV